MTTSLILGFLWVILATAIALMPRRIHWPGAVGLIATGIPLLGYITWENGPLVGGVALVAGASILRWPLFRLASWLRRLAGSRAR